ncbi:MAG: ribonuclease HIII [Planctomycetes bacterium]|nr:ribonuclease HIII [Planctomycetota bacterium]MCW8135027.1 ribonuclease HIII [Planctomycetota bacterium]
MDFAAYCANLINRVNAAGWVVQSQKTIPYGVQYNLSDKAGRSASLNAYSGKKGFSNVPGGKDGAALAADLGLPAPGAPLPEATSGDPFRLGAPRVGGDESGKGDFFGPLVVAAFHLDSATEKQLAGSGITDSKALTDAKITRLAGVLDKTGRGEVLTMMPREYNPEYQRTGNLNVLLSRLHGRCIGALIKRLGAPKSILVDEFMRDSTELAAAISAPKGVKLLTRTKAESDLAVAAASVLARAAFVEGLKELGHEFGQEFPPGAGDPVIKAGRAFVRSFGKAQLVNVAKTHFKTTERL